jgi:hypothetical protein
MNYMGSSASTYVKRIVLFGSAVLACVGLFWIGRSFLVNGELRFGNPVGGADLSGTVAANTEPPRVVRAEVVRAEGGSGVRIGDRCEFLVNRHLTKDGSWLCNAQVMCGERLVYGGPERGYFPCRLDEAQRREVVGTDGATTKQDQDGALYLDTRKGVMKVWDDERGTFGKFKLEADVISVN